MIRSSGSEMSYDVIISSIQLPDMSGFDLFMKLKDQLEPDPVPLILMSGFGYDSGHTIPQGSAGRASRQRGALQTLPTGSAPGDRGGNDRGPRKGSAGLTTTSSDLISRAALRGRC